ncbi:MAG: GIY-YIG nuclease family protein [Halodesulfurarchaeum sp.]|nr:GIY-YIG nuclease family protein [Halodesulfurarchaeum sp.]
MEPGTYTILLELETNTAVAFGAAGSRALEVGFYAYTGSAFGHGGLTRVDRHERVCRGMNDSRHWHVDSLLGDPHVSWVGAWASPNRRAECEIAASVPGRRVSGIGATDCSCNSHLTFHPGRGELITAIDAIHEERYS